MRARNGGATVSRMTSLSPLYQRDPRVHWQNRAGAQAAPIPDPPGSTWLFSISQSTAFARSQTAAAAKCQKCRWERSEVRGKVRGEAEGGVSAPLYQSWLGYAYLFSSSNEVTDEDRRRGWFYLNLTESLIARRRIYSSNAKKIMHFLPPPSVFYHK